MMVMACSNCGTAVPGAARVCPKCGYVFSSQQRAAALDVRRSLVLVVTAAIVVGAVLAVALIH